jgi:hypothetical protein
MITLPTWPAETPVAENSFGVTIALAGKTD